MGKESGRALTQAQVRKFARRQLDAVDDADDKRAAAEEALARCDSTGIKEAVLELSLSSPEEVRDAFVVSALHSEDRSLVRTAAESLMHMSSMGEFVDLLEECMDADEQVVRQRAAEAVDQTSDPRALSLLAKALEDEEIAVRRAAAGTLEWIAASRYRPLKDAALKQMRDPESELFLATVNNDDPQVRLHLARSLGYTASESSVPLLKRLAVDDDREVRHEALMGLANIKSEEAMEVVSENIPGSEYVTISSVLDTLATNLGPASERFLEFLKQALDHKEPEVRRHAVLMLYKYPPSQSKELLLAAAKDKDFEVAQRAAELLRVRFPGKAGEWLEEEALQSDEDTATLAIWEAGNVGQEADRHPERGESSEEVEGMLERTAMRGSPATRTHAVSELSTLRDIAQSEALKAALVDDDSSVRSAAADSLTYTRDAGYLVDIVRTHSDPLIRRRALEALMDNPGGVVDKSGPQRTLDFSYTRTAPVAMFRYFMDALDDEDEGVKRYACEAIGQCAGNTGAAPVRAATDRLDELARDSSVSQMTRETASRVIEEMEEMECAELILTSTKNTLAWFVPITVHTDALDYNRSEKTFRVKPEAGVQAGQVQDLWENRLSIPEENIKTMVDAVRNGTEIPLDEGKVILRRLTRAVRTALTLICRGARALRQMGRKDHLEHVQKWLEALKKAPAPEWGEAGFLGKWEKYLRWLRGCAMASTIRAVQELSDNYDASALDEVADSDDPMVRLSALTEKAYLMSNREDVLDEIEDLCGKYDDEEEDLAVALGRAGVLLLESGRESGAEYTAQALEDADSLDRVDLTWKVMFACREESAADMVDAQISECEPGSFAGLTLGCALRGAGREPGADPIPEELPDDASSEVKCACLGLEAMRGDKKAADRLKEVLRRGTGKVRFYSALFLGLARVWSATGVLAAVSDSDVPFVLRLLCGSMLVRRGHSGSLNWFQKVVKGTSGTHEARTGVELAKGVEDCVGLMLHCNDVNVGRFV